MGSIEESREWDGVVMEPVISQDQYSLNDAVFMNEDGQIIDVWDVDSDEAVIEDQIEYTVIGRTESEPNSVNVSNAITEQGKKEQIEEEEEEE